MALITITEALAELKTLASRIEKKRNSVNRYFARDGQMKDPLADELPGGTKEFVKRERQAIGDLEERIIRIRVRIQAANVATALEVNGVTRTIGEWLAFRREVAQGRKGFLDVMAGHLNAVRMEAKKAGRAVSTEERPADVVIAVSETELAAEIEAHATLMGTLDGRLSLINATTTIDV